MINSRFLITALLFQALPLGSLSAHSAEGEVVLISDLSPYVVRQTVVIDETETCLRAVRTEIMRSEAVLFEGKNCLEELVVGFTPDELPHQNDHEAVRSFLRATAPVTVIMSNEVEPRTRVDAYPRLSPVDADSDLFSARRDPDADLICYRKANHYMLCVQISPVYTGPLLAASW